MKNKIVHHLLIVSSLFIAAIVSAEESPAGVCTIELSGIRVNQGGNIIVALYSGEENWLKRDKTYAVKTIEVTSNIATVNFDGVVYNREYALFVYHDRNDNKKLDFRGFPFPKPNEGIAVSNNAVRWGKPFYDKASFTIGSQAVKQSIPMHYY